VSVHNDDGSCVLDKEEGVEGTGVAKETRRVVEDGVRNSNLLDDFLFPVDQLQWSVRLTNFQDTSKY
jgi:hypothetical protein